MSIDYEAIDELMLEKMSRKELIAEIKHLQAEQGEYESKFSDLRAKLEAEEKKCSMLQKSNDGLQEDIDNMNDQLKEIGDRYQKSVGEHYQQYLDMKQERDDLRQELLELKAEKESNQQECVACSKHKDTLESQTAALRGALIDCGIALLNGENIDAALKKRQLALQLTSGDNRYAGLTLTEAIQKEMERHRNALVDIAAALGEGEK